MKVAIILNSPNEIVSVQEAEVIYTDGGYRFQKKLGKKVVALVGDFDTLSEIPQGENIIKLDVEKDFTDGEKAIRIAKDYGYSEVVIYGATCGKTEHVLGNLALLKIAKDLGLTAKIVDGDRTIILAHENTQLIVKKGGLLSIIPYGGNCVFSHSEGLYYPLDGLTLTVGDTRGISNVCLQDKVSLAIVSGEALVVYQVE